MADDRLAAVWARVSTPEQAELSLESQVTRVESKLRSLGFKVPPEYVFRTDWTSLNLTPCPEFQSLLQLARQGRIDAVGTLDRDRFQAIGLDRMIFMAECRHKGIEIIVCQGPPFLEGPEGNIVEVALAVAKEIQVLRASQGAKDGIHDRVKLRRLSATGEHRVFGYRWQTPQLLVPDDNWEFVNWTCRQGLHGVPTRSIQRQLKGKGLSTSCQTVYRWLTNPVYGGRYYGLRREAIEPSYRKQGKGGRPTYGRSSTRHLPFEQWTYVPEIQVSNPPLTWEEWLILQRRLEKNKVLAKRNATHDYLLRSLIFCDYHQRRYTGLPSHGKWLYVCPKPQHCPRPRLNGPKLEAEVKEYCRRLFTDREVMKSEMNEHLDGRDGLGEKLKNELAVLNRKRTRSLNEETELEARNLRGLIDPEVYPAVKARLRAERTWCDEREDEVQAQLDGLSQQEAALMSLKEVHARIGDRFDTATNAEWREVFIALDLSVHVLEDGDIEIRAAIPLKAGKEAGIVSSGS
jgi:hypothetical protein